MVLRIVNVTWRYCIGSFQNTYLFIFCALFNDGINFFKIQNIQGEKCKKKYFYVKNKGKTQLPVNRFGWKSNQFLAKTSWIGIPNFFQIRSVILEIWHRQTDRLHTYRQTPWHFLFYSSRSAKIQILIKIWDDIFFRFF